jgi:hypothetical protein
MRIWFCLIILLPNGKRGVLTPIESETGKFLYRKITNISTGTLLGVYAHLDPLAPRSMGVSK